MIRLKCAFYFGLSMGTNGTSAQLLASFDGHWAVDRRSVAVSSHILHSSTSTQEHFIRTPTRIDTIFLLYLLGCALFCMLGGGYCGEKLLVTG